MLFFEGYQHVIAIYYWIEHVRFVVYMFARLKEEKDLGEIARNTR